MKESLEQLQRFVHSVTEEQMVLDSVYKKRLELGKGAEGSEKKSEEEGEEQRKEEGEEQAVAVNNSNSKV